MDKRNQFQIKHLTIKLTEYTNKLEQLKIKQKELIDSIDDLVVNNSIQNEHRQNLIEQKKSLEARIQIYKNDLNIYRSEFIQLNNDIQYLPIDLEKQQKQEQDIYDDEINNIIGRTQETEQLHNDKLKYLDIEKLKLLEEIKERQKQISLSNENISSIQEQSHSHRKNTILELQQKKQQKILITSTLDEFNKKKELYNNNTITISKKIENLIELKGQLIDIHYANSQMNITEYLEYIRKNTNVNELCSKDELFPMEEFNFNNPIELLNSLISNIEKQIQNAKYNLSSLGAKQIQMDKTINITIKNMKNEMEPVSRTKVISFKDNYKLAKLEKTKLEENLSLLEARLNSWDVEVVNKTILDYKTALNILDEDKIRAKDRLMIMLSRINTEYTSTIKIKEDRIRQINRECANINANIKQMNQELIILEKEIKKQDSKRMELDELNKQIGNTELAIHKIKIDITSLSSL